MRRRRGVSIEKMNIALICIVLICVKQKGQNSNTFSVFAEYIHTNNRSIVVKNPIYTKSRPFSLFSFPLWFIIVSTFCINSQMFDSVAPGCVGWMPFLCIVPSSQIKAEDGGDTPLWATVKLHVEWIRKPVPSPLPLLFTQRYYNFSISETAAVAQPVGVVAVSQSSTPVWFNIIGKNIYIRY